MHLKHGCNTFLPLPAGKVDSSKLEVSDSIPGMPTIWKVYTTFFHKILYQIFTTPNFAIPKYVRTKSPPPPPVPPYGARLWRRFATCIASYTDGLRTLCLIAQKGLLQVCQIKEKTTIPGRTPATHHLNRCPQRARSTQHQDSPTALLHAAAHGNCPSHARGRVPHPSVCPLRNVLR